MFAMVLKLRQAFIGFALDVAKRIMPVILILSGVNNGLQS
jgi:hypothetical protein